MNAGILCCLAAAAVTAALSQRFAVPERGARKKTARLWGGAIACVVGLALAAFLLLPTARPLTATLLALAVFLLLLLVNKAKLAVLKEPLVLADAALLPQVFRYPHLYFPFLPLRAMGLALVLLCGALAGLIVLEEPFVRDGSLLAALVVLAVGPVVLLLLLRSGRLAPLASFLLRRCPVSHDPLADARRCGALAAAILHPVLAGAMEKQDARMPAYFRGHTRMPPNSRWPEALETLLRETRELSPEEMPHIVLVQAESLCPIQDWLSPEQNAALDGRLPNLDILWRQGRLLPTPKNAFGAYTMRAEFSMLTGLQLPALGPFGHNPYLAAQRRPFWSLARHLGQQGCETLCLHPYAKEFFRRDKVMPNLGFEHFIGLEDLPAIELFGPYVADQALGAWMIERLQGATRPLFCFVITMEAHGPWLPGRLTQEQMAACLPREHFPLFSPQTLLYLCHLCNTDSMLGMLLAAGATLSRPLELLVYGDHAPSLDCLRGER